MTRLSRLIHIGLALVLVWSTLALAEGGYVDNQDGTITDPEHGLMWQKADDGVERSWQEAVSYCDALELADHKDWILPKAYQLEGLINTAYSPTIDPLFSVKSSYYWSATDSADSANSAKYVNFFYGNTYTYSKDNPYYVLCVRESTATPDKGLAAVFTGAPTADKPLVIRFKATITGGSEPYFYDWDFGDGGTASASTPTHEFAKEGRYKILLTVSDNDGAVAVATQEIALPLAELSAVGPGAELSGKAGEVPTEGVPVLTESVSPPTGPAPGKGGSGGATPEAGGVPATQAVPSHQGVMDVSASGQGMPYKDGALGHGLLAYTFANAMAGDGDSNKDGTVTASEIQGYLGQAIKSLSTGQQSPLITREGDDFPVCASPSGATYVLAIGIGHDLAGAALVADQDAELVRKAVEDKCQRTKTMMLTAGHANRQDILQALVQIGSLLTTDDTLLVYMGAANGMDNGRLNWYVNDSRKELSWFTGIYHDQLLQFLKTLPVGHILILGEKN